MECTLYKPLEGKKIICTACKHYCRILPNHSGICGVRQNRAGKLHLLVYGRAAAAHVDPIEKKPLFHFLPGTKVLSIGTVGCNFGCSFCQNWNISQVGRDIRMRLLKDETPELQDVEIKGFGYDLPPEKIIEICEEQSIPSIAFTYNEPIIAFEYLLDTFKIAKEKGIKCVMVSSGYETDEALELLEPYLDGINIDLKGFNEDYYRQVCKASLQPVLETIRHTHERGIWMELTTLIIPGHNDSDEEITQIARFIAGISTEIPWHITAFHPDYEMQDTPATHKDSLLRAFEIGKQAGLAYVYTGNIIDEEHASTRCPNCETLVLRRRWHETSSNDLDGGACAHCHARLPGVWT